MEYLFRLIYVSENKHTLRFPQCVVVVTNM